MAVTAAATANSNAAVVAVETAVPAAATTTAVSEVLNPVVLAAEVATQRHPIRDSAAVEDQHLRKPRWWQQLQQHSLVGVSEYQSIGS